MRDDDLFDDDWRKLCAVAMLAGLFAVDWTRRIGGTSAWTILIIGIVLGGFAGWVSARPQPNTILRRVALLAVAGLPVAVFLAGFVEPMLLYSVPPVGLGLLAASMLVRGLVLLRRSQ